MKARKARNGYAASSALPTANGIGEMNALMSHRLMSKWRRYEVASSAIAVNYHAVTIVSTRNVVNNWEGDEYHRPAN